MSWILWFFVGMIFGGFSLICLALCQVQKKDDTSEKVCFAASIEVEGVTLYLGRKGVWGEFSVTDTLITSNVKDLTKKYIETTGEEMDDEVSIEKVGIKTKFIQSF